MSEPKDKSFDHDEVYEAEVRPHMDALFHACDRLGLNMVAYVEVAEMDRGDQKVLGVRSSKCMHQPDDGKPRMFHKLAALCESIMGGAIQGDKLEVLVALLAHTLREREKEKH